MLFVVMLKLYFFINQGFTKNLIIECLVPNDVLGIFEVKGAKIFLSLLTILLSKMLFRVQNENAFYKQ